jgi:hypothetical protein
MAENINKEEKQARLRSRLYPRYDLEEAIRFIQSIQKLGGNRVSNQAIAAEIGKGVTNSGFTGRVSCAKQFGLLIQEGGKLSLSSLAKEVVFPKGEIEKAMAIRQALLSPEVYRELIEAFGGKTLPDQSTLANRLVHDFRIEAAAKDVAARMFIRSVQYANVLKNGILVISEEAATEDGTASKEDEGLSPFQQLPQRQQKVLPVATVQGAVFQDNGAGWSIIVRSQQPLNSKTKQKLIEVAELLDEVNTEKRE